MRTKIMLCTLAGILALSSAVFAGSRLAHDDHEQDRADIRAHIESIFRAFINKDEATLAKTHSDDWRGFMPGSTSVMRGHDSYMKLAAGTVKSQGGMTSFKIVDYDVTFPAKDVAVINYVAEVEGSFGDGKQTYSTKYRTLDVYAKRADGWVQVSTNTALHPDVTAKAQTTPRQPSDSFKKALFDARDAVWRAWYAGDKAKLEKLIPDDAVAINPGNGPWQDRASILSSSESVSKSGVKLVKLDFPKTEIQGYGSTFILYSRYTVETERAGEKRQSAGCATEVFLFKDGVFLNTGWHLDADK